MSDEDVAEKAKRDGTTRAVASMEKACELDEKLIFAIEMHRQHSFICMS